MQLHYDRYSIYLGYLFAKRLQGNIVLHLQKKPGFNFAEEQIQLGFYTIISYKISF